MGHGKKLTLKHPSMNKNKKIKQNWPLRLFVFLFVIISIILFHRDFGEQFNCYLRGQANIISQEWFMVVLNILLFVALLIPLSFDVRPLGRIRHNHRLFRVVVY